MLVSRFRLDRLNLDGHVMLTVVQLLVRVRFHLKDEMS